MSSFPENLRKIVARPRSIRLVADEAGIDEKTIRNWLKKQDPAGNVKARPFLEAIDLPWPDALGDYELTPEWWAGFLARFDTTPAQQAIAYLKGADWASLTPAQQGAIHGVVTAFADPSARPAASVNGAARRRRRAG